MIITKPCVVSLTWQLSDAQGRPIDELAEPTEFLFGGDDLLPAVEDALAGQEAGFETTLQLEPAQAFGEYDPKLVFFEERSRLSADIDVGMQFEGVPPGAATTGMPSEAIYTVTEVYPDHVVLDGNHPLAGIALRIRLVVRDVRAATEDEVEAGTLGTPAVSVLHAAPPGAQVH